MLKENGEYFSEALSVLNKEIRLRAFVDVIDSSAYGSAVIISVLDKLLDKGLITLDQYIKNVPGEYFENYSNLIGGDSDA